MDEKAIPSNLLLFIVYTFAKSAGADIENAIFNSHDIRFCGSLVFKADPLQYDIAWSRKDENTICGCAGDDCLIAASTFNSDRF